MHLGWQDVPTALQPTNLRPANFFKSSCAPQRYLEYAPFIDSGSDGSRTSSDGAAGVSPDYKVGSQPFSAKEHGSIPGRTSILINFVVQLITTFLVMLAEADAPGWQDVPTALQPTTLRPVNLSRAHAHFNDTWITHPSLTAALTGLERAVTALQASRRSIK
ncbi:hypothetical protein MRX96_045271 [Rhipicephalus microplus]